MLTRPATADDFRDIFERDPPPIWIGLVALDPGAFHGKPVAAGIVFWDEQGRAWGTFSTRAPLLPMTMHRAAVRMLDALREAKEPALYVHCDRSTPGAILWLERLGFRPLPDMTTDPNYPVWVRGFGD